MKNALEIKSLKKIYEGGKQALKEVSLNVAEGDFFALLGPNGAGKTTLISITCGLVNKTEGKIIVQGHDIDIDGDIAKVHIGLVPQEYNADIFETVENVLYTQAGYYGISRSEAKEQIDMLLTKLSLEDKRKVQTIALSGGMKRRLMIARALVHKPTLLFLDEPTAGVDVELRHEMWKYLAELNKSGVTIILTTHYLEEAENLCRNIAIISNGEIKREGTMEEVRGGKRLEDIYMEIIKEAGGSQEPVLSKI
ncbi:MAG: transporter [Candidatus Nomurabacteria bacterium]|nr:transporter [Candidatus Nomurabacteria bacterium]